MNTTISIIGDAARINVKLHIACHTVWRSSYHHFSAFAIYKVNSIIRFYKITCFTIIL
nr:MAG TPA: hypothetical protein [Caudoviricetes sp.]